MPRILYLAAAVAALIQPSGFALPSPPSLFNRSYGTDIATSTGTLVGASASVCAVLLSWYIQYRVNKKIDERVRQLEGQLPASQARLDEERLRSREREDSDRRQLTEKDTEIRGIEPSS